MQLPSNRPPQTPLLCTALQKVRYDPALALIVDIRTVLPGSGATAPVGWAALPIFESGPGRYVASGYYQLPLFQVSSCLVTVQHCCLCDPDLPAVQAMMRSSLRHCELHLQRCLHCARP